MTRFQRELRRRISPGHAAGLARFFKTGRGEYGEGDRFLGVRMPGIRDVARMDDGGSEVDHLLGSPWHEERMLGLLILVRRFGRSGDAGRRAIYIHYLANTRAVNNWDLVDASAPGIAGAWLLDRPRAILHRLAKSSSLWERRIAIISTLAFIRACDLQETFLLCERLLQDPEDLLHKACGWMLREAGKRDQEALVGFLRRHAGVMPRTMLRYAIERLPAGRRRAMMEL